MSMFTNFLKRYRITQCLLQRSLLLIAHSLQQCISNTYRLPVFSISHMMDKQMKHAFCLVVKLGFISVDK
jgi:hypothetical protein